MGNFSQGEQFYFSVVADLLETLRPRRFSPKTLSSGAAARLATI
jgi:hypothetical protein